jgi:hypothetical protein
MRWFDTQELAARAGALAAEYARHRASAAATGTAPARRYERVRAEAVAFAASLGWNLYRKGRYFQALRAALIAQAVPEAEAEDFVRSVVVGPLAALDARRRDRP